MTNYNTSVCHVPATPLGMPPACWSVEHWCRSCYRRVELDQLIEHARQHEVEVVATD